MNINSRHSLVRILVGFALLFAALSVWAKPAHEFTTGKLVDITSEERTDKGTTHAYAIYQVQLGDLIYYGRGEKLAKHPGEAGHGMIVGDPIQAAIDGKDLIIQRPDGKEIKTKIIKRQRAGTR